MMHITATHCAALIDDFPDAWRRLHPEDRGKFTVWDMKTNGRPFNRGCRIDLALVSKGLLPKITACEIRYDLPPRWSDHVPLVLDLDLAPPPAPRGAAPCREWLRLRARFVDPRQRSIAAMLGGGGGGGKRPAQKGAAVAPAAAAAGGGGSAAAADADATATAAGAAAAAAGGGDAEAAGGVPLQGPDDEPAAKRQRAEANEDSAGGPATSGPSSSAADVAAGSSKGDTSAAPQSKATRAPARSSLAKSKGGSAGSKGGSAGSKGGTDSKQKPLTAFFAPAAGKGQESS